MSLNFYADAALTLQLSAVTPKRFLFPNKGGIKTSQVWLGDPYKTKCTIQANIGANHIDLADTSEFLDATAILATSSGHAVAISGSNTIHYTGKTQNQLTGVTGITANILVGDVVYPKVVYKGVAGANVEVFPTGTDLLNFGVRVAVGATTVLSFPGLPAIFTGTSILIGVANAVEVFLSAQVPDGADQEFTHFSLQANNLFKRDFDDTTAFSTTEGTYAPAGALYAYRHDEPLKIPIRILPLNRQVLPDTPGFVVGEYRWRGDVDRNATALVPTNWNMDPNTIGLEKFIAGIGDQNDLEPEELVEVQDSIRMVLHRGEYFTGANRYYLPADWNLEFIPCSIAAANIDGTVTLHTQKEPRDEAPVFVGTYILDNQHFYEKGLNYSYVATLLNPDGTPRTDLPDRYFQLDRKTKTITLNKSLGHAFVFLGSVSGQAIDYFDIPVYPVDNIDVVYVDQGPNLPFIYATTWSFDREQGTIQVPNLPGSLSGQPIFAICAPAVAVLYDAGPDDTREIDTIDLNPAFSGLASGFYYLQHRRQRPASLVLSCDKPRIPVPATQASIIGLVAFGPVYFENDFALLSVTAFGSVSGETIPNAKLDVDVDSATFSGTVNYKDPLTETVSVVTGGDGTANLIFIPKGGFGVWIPTSTGNAATPLGGLATTNITHDTLVLPAGVPLSQIWNAQEGWLVTAYTVLDDDPLFGMIGGDPAHGEIVWQTTGTPGHSDYKTNGERRAWRTGNVSSGDLILPIDALDQAGHSYTSAAFSGSVWQLVYGEALPQNDSLVTDIGAYFVTFVQRVLIRMKLENSNLFSNYILLQMDVPQLILENPWLVLDDAIQGRLEQFRLGFVRRS
jgi:hypothetical protein